ncbi:hypothetical protein [Staphylococcus argensis]|uniref:Uncharacterized protein n=1 Tax=Staphylococcus argensis TaxID=1607738 RepID=A0A2K4FAG4_9STAP|nr:hypothetical protein [Staphylococcus argensis]MCY6991489.1 hypothetical protein [Staphylococcus argensis]POA08277.1 hypothetical protein CD039_09290 [Staphylococcus argensis]
MNNLKLIIFCILLVLPIDYILIISYYYDALPVYFIVEVIIGIIVGIYVKYLKILSKILIAKIVGIIISYFLVSFSLKSTEDVIVAFAPLTPEQHTFVLGFIFLITTIIVMGIKYIFTSKNNSTR